MTGGFITLEGLDGAGTTTQARMLTDALRNAGYIAEITGEPTENPVGKLIRQVLQGTPPDFDRKALALLFAADRIDHCETLIRPVVNKGGFVISDRYVHSSLAYQVENAPLNWIETINKFAIQPDLVIFLDVSPKVAMNRVEKRGSTHEIFEKLEFQQRVMKNYLTAINRLSMEKCLIIDGEKNINIVRDLVIQRVWTQFDLDLQKI